MRVNRLTEHFFHAPSGVFSHSEVAAMMPGSEFSRHGLVKRALANGEFLPLRRGLYCLAPRYQKKPVSACALAQRIYGPSYVSMETALSLHGWIPEAVHACTCASFGPARDFDTPLGIFLYRRIPQRVFYADVERGVDSHGNVCFMASPAKALADYMYVHRLDGEAEKVFACLRIESEESAAVAPEQLDILAENYTNSRVRRFLASWKEILTR